MSPELIKGHDPDRQYSQEELGDLGKDIDFELRIIADSLRYEIRTKEGLPEEKEHSPWWVDEMDTLSGLVERFVEGDLRVGRINQSSKQVTFGHYSTQQKVFTGELAYMTYYQFGHGIFANPRQPNGILPSVKEEAIPQLSITYNWLANEDGEGFSGVTDQLWNISSAYRKDFPELLDKRFKGAASPVKEQQIKKLKKDGEALAKIAVESVEIELQDMYYSPDLEKPLSWPRMRLAIYKHLDKSMTLVLVGRSERKPDEPVTIPLLVRNSGGRLIDETPNLGNLKNLHTIISSAMRHYAST